MHQLREYIPRKCDMHFAFYLCISSTTRATKNHTATEKAMSKVFESMGYELCVVVVVTVTVNVSLNENLFVWFGLLHMLMHAAIFEVLAGNWCAWHGDDASQKNDELFIVHKISKRDPFFGTIAGPMLSYLCMCWVFFACFFVAFLFHKLRNQNQSNLNHEFSRYIPSSPPLRSWSNHHYQHQDPPLTCSPVFNVRFFLANFMRIFDSPKRIFHSTNQWMHACICTWNLDQSERENASETSEREPEKNSWKFHNFICTNGSNVHDFRKYIHITITAKTTTTKKRKQKH